MEEWISDTRRNSPTFRCWNILIRWELLVLSLIRSLRNRDFALNVISLKRLVQFFFALNHQNYARWVPVHIRDMEHLPESVRGEFEVNGNCVVKKTKKRFSSMPIDQAHEQNNEMVKGSGGAVCLTDHPTAFIKWMIAGHEYARIINEFEGLEMQKDPGHHHEETIVVLCMYVFL
ncbi:hypothetical protein DPMN_107197 [Dreissena polymorpha]|uniref:Uncharacterized protein n=1 Tax=Dreissena polymorpha TaxID=45954 RepID=A0A9D4QJP6_DREPO|nr:hypothetical protein DPMN_107197 [Dreissena polymorpha]